MQHRYVYAYRYRNDTYMAILAQILPDPRFPGPSTITDNTRLSSPIPKPVKIVAFARIPGQISPVNLEAINGLYQQTQEGWKVAVTWKTTRADPRLGTEE